MTPCLPLFASCMGVMRIRTPAYYRIHASLRQEVRKGSFSEKQQRHRQRSRHFKKTGELRAG